MFITIRKYLQIWDLNGCREFYSSCWYYFAAVTSSIALTESAVSTLEDEIGWSRRKSTAVIGIIMIALGTLSCLGIWTAGICKNHWNAVPGFL